MSTNCALLATINALLRFIEKLLYLQLRLVDLVSKIIYYSHNGYSDGFA
jgi:hypothetical protein